MVLAELGHKITSALKSLNNTIVIDEIALNALLKKICRALIEADVNIRLVQKLRDNVHAEVDINNIPQGMNKRLMIQRMVFKQLLALLDPGVSTWQPVKGKTNVIMLVGLQGSGKTTAVSKLAYYYRKRGWTTCVVCADTFRAGAFDQLKQNATKARIPFYGSYTETDPVVIAMEGVERFKEDHFDIIIIDTSGRHKQDDSLFEEMLQLTNAIEPNNVVYVMDASMGQACEVQALAFKSKVDVASVIATKLDSHAKGGGALSAVAATNSPIIFIGTGEHIDDFELFNAQLFVKKLLGMGDIEGLMESVRDLTLSEKAESTKNKNDSPRGVFSLRDMYDTIKILMTTGPTSLVFRSLPGFDAKFARIENEMECQRRVKRMLIMMDSMTEEELDNPKGMKLFHQQRSRMERVVRGAGVEVCELNRMFLLYKVMAYTMKKNGGVKDIVKGKRSDTRAGQCDSHYMNRLRQGFSATMHPNHLQQMGVMSGFGNKMRKIHNDTKQMNGGKECSRTQFLLNLNLNIV